MDDARDADRWWTGLSERRRAQIHRMMCREAREQPVPAGQTAMDVPQQARAGR